MDGFDKTERVARIVDEREETSENMGEPTAGASVINTGPHGFWLRVGHKAYFLDFDKFPSFRNATEAQISSVELLENDHVSWPELNLDVTLESITRPSEFPRVYTE